MARPWSTEEVEATVASYFEMLRLELAGLPYSKTDFNGRLRQVLDNRTKAAVEYKYQNISAVLINHGQGYIKGYLPAQNYQRALEASVLEQRRLHDEVGRPDLARRIRWVSRDEGDGLGYDIRSFEAHGSERLIEVKTTGLGKYFPFLLTRGELECSRRERERYHLYRLFDFGEKPRLYVLNGALDDVCTLTPTTFRASPGQRA